MHKLFNQLTINKLLKKWNDRSHEAASKKTKQMNQRETLKRMNTVELWIEEKQKVIALLVFTKEIISVSIKGIVVDDQIL